MNDHKKSVTYITKVDLKNDVGVASKLKEMQLALENFGYSSYIQNVTKDRIVSFIFKIHKIIKNSGSNIIIVRSFGVLNICIIPTLIYYRIKGIIFIIDMPTPRSSALYEVLPYRKGIRKFGYLLLHYLHGPWTLWVYNRIIQYGDENNYFLWGNQKKTIVIGNSINIKRIKIRKNNYTWPTDELKLIAVAKFSNHHGYDRLLRAISSWNSSGKKIKITLSLIGDGKIDGELRQLVDSLNLAEFVKMPGRMDTSEIHREYSKHHLAVSSLGLYRLKMYRSGVLKAREYCLAGIPFIAAGDDFDFDKSCPFRYEVKHEDEVDSILEQIELFLETRDQYSDQEIRDYAIKHLSFESKLERMGIPDLRDHRE